MRRIELVTSDLSFVALVEIAPFPDRGMPEVVLWGERTFTRGAQATQLVDGPWRYVEAFAFVSRTPSPGLPREEHQHSKCPHGIAQFVGIDNPCAECAPPPVDRSAITTLHGTPIDALREQQAAQPVGQHADYIVLTEEERAKGFVRPVRRTYKHLKCGSTTTMGRALAETYARDPKFYSKTMCCHCNGHFPVGATGEFVWDGSDEKVGT